jgi:hypothetical protein
VIEVPESVRLPPKRVVITICTTENPVKDFNRPSQKVKEYSVGDADFVTEHAATVAPLIVFDSIGTFAVPDMIRMSNVLG